MPLELDTRLVPQRHDGGVLALDHDHDAVKLVGGRVVFRVQGPDSTRRRRCGQGMLGRASLKSRRLIYTLN